MNNQQKDKIIEEALMLLDQGKSESFILGLYPDFKNELTDLFQTIDVLQKQKSIIPSEKLLQDTLNKIAFESKIKSPYQEGVLHGNLWFRFSRVQKYSLTSLAVILIITGGVFLNKNTNPPQEMVNNVSQQTQQTMTSQTDNSDSALQQDLNSIDVQMSELESDNSSQQ